MGGIDYRQPTPEYLARQREFNRRWEAQRKELPQTPAVIYLPPPEPRANAVGIPLIPITKTSKEN